MYLALAAADDDGASVAADADHESRRFAAGVSGAADGTPPRTRSVAENQATPLPASASAAALVQVEGARCPHCGCQQLRPWGRASGLPRYRCRDCRRTFNGLTGTPLAHLRKKDRWAAQAEALITVESVATAAKRCDIAETTAFRWRHRFLAASTLDKPSRLSGIVEADETVILGSIQGQAVRSSPSGTQARRQSCQTRRIGRANSHSRRPRQARSDDRRGSSQAQPRRNHHRAWWCCHPGQPTVLRWRQGDRRLRAQGGNSLPNLAVAGRAKA